MQLSEQFQIPQRKVFSGVLRKLIIRSNNDEEPLAIVSESSSPDSIEEVNSDEDVDEF